MPTGESNNLTELLNQKRAEMEKYRQEIKTSCEEELKTARNNLREWRKAVERESLNAIHQSESRRADLKLMLWWLIPLLLAVGSLSGIMLTRTIMLREQSWMIPTKMRYQDGQQKFLIVTETEVIRAQRDDNGRRYLPLSKASGGK